MRLEVTSEVIAHVLAQAAAAVPEECCGLLLGPRPGPDGAIRIDAARAAQNIAEDRLRRFEIDPAALIAAHRAARAGGPHLLGYYHSHPQGQPQPSAVDCEHASADGRIWAIAAEGRVGFWRDGDAGFEPLSYQVAPVYG